MITSVDDPPDAGRVELRRRQEYLDQRHAGGAGDESGADKAAEMQMMAISVILDDRKGSVKGNDMLPVDEDASRGMVMARRQRIREGAWVRVVTGIKVLDESERWLCSGSGRWMI